jgi:hypothetical protein
MRRRGENISSMDVKAVIALDRGPLLLDGERWDFNEPKTLMSLRSGVTGGDDNRWHYDIQDRW